MRLTFLLLVAAIAACTTKETPADIIIRGGKIYTGVTESPMAEAVVVRGDTIIYVGDTAIVRKWEGPATRIIDLGGGTMTAGFIESHGHIMGMGYGEMQLDLTKTKSYDEVVSLVAEAVKRASPGEWILGRGWHQDKWTEKPKITIGGFQTHAALSAVSPNNPVFLAHVSGHAAMVNAKAMQIAGLGQLSKEKVRSERIDGGEVIRDPLGNPTGILIDEAEMLVVDHIPPSNERTDDQALTLAMEACARNGITTFQNAGTEGRIVKLLQRFKKEGRLSTRVYAMLERSELREWFDRGPEVDPQHRLTIRSIKLHCDGALGTRSAWLLEPYSDGNTVGLPTLPMDTVLQIAREALAHGFQVCSHAIGDRANREVLDRYERAFSENASRAKDCRFRIEHAQHLNPSDIPRFGKLGVIASMQAIHLSSDRPWAIQRLGQKRIEEGAYMWQSLLKSGAKIVNGTDVPVEPINPVACFYASVTRRTLGGEPIGGYEPAEKMTREQALRSYTLDAAYGAFEEAFKGSIEKGKLADFTVFDRDIMRVAEDSLLFTNIAMTIVGGKVVYDRAGARTGR